MGAVGGEYDKLREEPDQFLEWFWSKGNGESLIELLNDYKYKDRVLKFEKLSPYVYGMVLSGKKVLNKSFNNKVLFNARFKLLKIGFTQVVDATDTADVRQPQDDGDVNDATTINGDAETADATAITCIELPQLVTAKNAKTDEIKAEYKGDGKLESVFMLRKSPLDPSSNIEFETRIREKLGLPIKPSYAKRLGLPSPKEWVLTTQEFVNRMNEYKDGMEESEKESGNDIDATIFEYEDFPEFKLSEKEKNSFRGIINIVIRDSV